MQQLLEQHIPGGVQSGTPSTKTQPLSTPEHPAAPWTTQETLGCSMSSSMSSILPRHAAHPISDGTRSVCAALWRRRIHESCTLTHLISSYYLCSIFTHILLITLKKRTYSSSWHESQRKGKKKKASLAVTNLTLVESNSICGRSQK